ncbi:MAG: tyrosine-type recombinase/integrase [Chroococcidiopsidaceae cyanobacterium CP_BM_RX_35]|nr:tyrosine-type recombinase/integrase [Chroococcidiopsidaceae cyanobacterium CP_BM_RX_35]
MQSKTPTGKNTWGVAALESFRKRLRIRFRVNNQQKSFTLGIADTSENRVKGESIVRQMHLDMLSGNFDSTLVKYKPVSHLTVVEAIKPKTGLDLAQLWDKYTEFRAKQVSETTLKLNYARVSSHIQKLPTKSLADAVLIRDSLLEKNSAYTAKRILTQINACCNWAMRSKLIDLNPFYEMAAEIKLSKTELESLDIDPFSKEEREIIIQAFKEHERYNRYAAFVEFLFLTGCRTSEAVGLKWKHISPDLSKITFSETIVNVSSKKIRQGLKTQDKRTFPCNKQLRLFLLSIKPENLEPDSPVFTSIKGQEINAHTFNAMCWHGCVNKGRRYVGIVQKLADEGKINHYRPQYQTRHTFITLCLDAGVEVKDVARWVGNTPEIIYKHYAGNKRDLQVPEIKQSY